MLEEKDISPGLLSQDGAITVGMPDCAVCKLRFGGDDCKIYTMIPDKYMFDHNNCPNVEIDKDSPFYENYCRCRNINTENQK